MDLDTFINTCWNTVKPYILMNAAEYKPPSDLKEETTDKPEEWDQETEGRFLYFKLMKKLVRVLFTVKINNMFHKTEI